MKSNGDSLTQLTFGEEMMMLGGIKKAKNSLPGMQILIQHLQQFMMLMEILLQNRIFFTVMEPGLLII